MNWGAIKAVRELPDKKMKMQDLNSHERRKRRADGHISVWHGSGEEFVPACRQYRISSDCQSLVVWCLTGGGLEQGAGRL